MELKEKFRNIDSLELTYPNLSIEDYSELFELEGRFTCSQCKSKRKFFCYKCCLPTPKFDRIPKVKLPIKVDIIKHFQEVIGKSTSPHAMILAPEDATIYIYPDIPDYSKEEGEVVLVFPASKSVSISSLFKGNKIDYKENHGLTPGYTIPTLLTRNLNEVIDQETPESEETTKKEYTLDNLPFKRVVFIDSTWKQCRGIYKDPRVSSLKSCVIQNRVTKFWRHQKGAPIWYLSTIEAIHSFLLEFHINAWGISKNYYDTALGDLQLDASFIQPSQIIEDQDEGKYDDSLCKPYSGQYDNMLFYFAFLHTLIHSYEHKKGQLYRTDE